MTRAEREAFLADVHIGVLAIDEPGRGPHALPIWYQYAGGECTMRIGDESRKAQLLRAAGRATLTVQTEIAPYRYVSVEGPVRIVDGADYDDLAMATRYLGPEWGKWYVEHAGAEETMLVVLTPEHWRSFDFSKAL